MRYTEKSFSVGGYSSKEFAESWERTFRAEKAKRPCKYCGRPCRGDYCSKACSEADDDE